MRINIKKIGLLEIIVILSLAYVIGMLLWTLSTRPAVEARADLVNENHKKVVDFINNDFYNSYTVYPEENMVVSERSQGRGIEFVSINIIPYKSKALVEKIQKAYEIVNL